MKRKSTRRNESINVLHILKDVESDSFFFFFYPITGLDRPLRLQKVEASRTSKHSAREGGKVASPTHRPPLTSGDTLGTHFCYRMSRTDGLSADGKITFQRPLWESSPRPSGL